MCAETSTPNGRSEAPALRLQRILLYPFLSEVDHGPGALRTHHR